MDRHSLLDSVRTLRSKVKERRFFLGLDAELQFTIGGGQWAIRR